MSTQPASPPVAVDQPPTAAATTDKGCAAIRSVSSPPWRSACASVAPAYSIAVTLGLVVIVVGHLAPAALLVGIRSDPVDGVRISRAEQGDAGLWDHVRVDHPRVRTNAGWLSGGWVVQIATVIAMTALARVGAGYLLTLLGLDRWADNDVRGDRRRRC